MSFTPYKFAAALLLTMMACTTHAHEIWLERNDTGPVRIYLGEPGEPESGETLDSLKGAIVFTSNRDSAFAITQKATHWEATVNEPGDVRLFSNSVWEPWQVGGAAWWQFWKDDKPTLQGGILEARTGRTETYGKLNFELVPTTKSGNTFTAYFRAKALPDLSIAVLTPSGNTSEIQTDANGVFTVDVNEKGRYLLSSVHNVEGQAMHSGKTVQSLLYITSLTFINQ